MKSFSAIIKENSKKALRNRWGKSIAVVLLFAAVNIFFSILHYVLAIALQIPAFVDSMGTPELFLDNPINTSFLAIAMSFTVTLAAFLILSPLQLGVSNWYYRMVGSEQEEVLAVFRYFETTTYLFRSWALQFWLLVKIALWWIVSLCPGYGLLLIGKYLYRNAQEDTLLLLSSVLGVCSAGVLVVGCVVACIANQRYFLARYLLATRRNIAVQKAIRESVRITHGHKLSLFRFHLSYLGWILPSLFVAPLLFTMPYYETGQAMYARILLESDQKQRQEELEEALAPSEEELETTPEDDTTTCQFTPQDPE